jgi:hypothetical protein
VAWDYLGALEIGVLGYAPWRSRIFLVVSIWEMRALAIAMTRLNHARFVLVVTIPRYRMYSDKREKHGAMTIDEAVM